MILDKIRFILIPCVALLYCSACSYLPEPDQDLRDIISVETRDYIELIPGQSKISNTAFLFYPGGLVDPHAYIELASGFARSGSGHHVIIAKMPVNLAVLAAKSAEKIIKDFPAERWVLGGHSLGGAMACTMLEKEPGLFGGLVLMAAYASGSVDLSRWDGAVLSITASNDGILDWEKFKEAKANLPAQSVYFEIPGGNHCGFGSYGQQKGDGEASISRETQHQQIVEQIQNFYLENGFE